MAQYESDSSGDEAQDYTETEVLLGYAHKDSKGETVSRLGGRPEWIVQDKPPSAALAKCKVCKDLMVLLLQLNGELPDRFPWHERRLYVFACRRKSCRRREGSIRALRGVRVTEDAASRIQEEEKDDGAKSEPPKPVSGLGESLFGVKAMGASSGSANPFSTSTSPITFSSKSPASQGNPFAVAASTPAPKEPSSSSQDTTGNLPKTFAEKLSLNNPQTSSPPPPPEPWPAEVYQPPPYTTLWIAEAEYETLDPTPLPRVSTSATTMDVDDPSSASSSGGGKEDKEVFESSMDAAFQKFADRVGQNPEQVIRYEFGGSPLLYSKEDPVGRLLGGGTSGVGVGTSGGMPRCPSCGAARVFEVQMTPHAIAALEGDDEGLEGMDWGTVIVGTCERDCQERGVGDGEPGYREEWIGVQWEELAAKR